MFRIAFAILALFFIAACAGSSVFFADHPNRTSIDGIAVVPDENGQWHSWHEGAVVNLGDAVTAKQRQITAIEVVSGCKVTDIAFREMPGLANFMTAAVKCP
jgi:hypothetical protein